MWLNKKGQGEFPVNKLLDILLKVVFIIAIIAIILLWAKPAYGEVVKWISSLW